MMFTKVDDQGNQKGQALIIVLLVMAVVLTVVLSSVSRSVTEVKTTAYEEDSLRAFSAAEAGVEDKLLNPVIGPIPTTYPDATDTSVYYSGEVSQPITPTRQFKYPRPLLSGESATFWIVSHDGDDNLTCGGGSCWGGSQIRVCYGAAGVTPEPAVEVSIYYDQTFQSVANPNNFSGVKVKRYLFDKLAATRGGGTDPGATPCNFDDGSNFTRRAVISTWPGCSTGAANAGCILFATVRMLYSSDQPVGIWTQGGSTELPGQGLVISSTGVAGESTRKVNVFRSHPEAPSLFDLAVFSGSALTK